MISTRKQIKLVVVVVALMIFGYINLFHLLGNLNFFYIYKALRTGLLIVIERVVDSFCWIY